MRYVNRRPMFAVFIMVACSSRTPTPAIAPRYGTANPPIVGVSPVAKAQLSQSVRAAVPDQEPAEFERRDLSRPLQIIEPASRCSPADWVPQKLEALLVRGNGAKRSSTGQSGAIDEPLGATCVDSPDSGSYPEQFSAVADGVRIRVLRETEAGRSGRGWSGVQCELELSLADGSGSPVVLGPKQVPPFNTVRAVLRSGSAVWLNIGFNGYRREFPLGGNRVVAVDLCDGHIAWQSKGGVSNGGLLLLGDYLITAYGFTSEPRFVFVLEAHSGNVVQKLPIVENVCPSKAWAPNWQPGESCDVPGQRVGAAMNPRIEEGIFIVDTNTGSSTFSFKY